MSMLSARRRPHRVMVRAGRCGRRGPGVAWAMNPFAETRMSDGDVRAPIEPGAEVPARGAPRPTRVAPDTVEARTQALGRALFRRVRAYRSSLVEAVGDRSMQLLAGDPRFRARLLRFIDALAGLDGDRTGVRVRRLLHEYLDADFRRVPLWLRLAIPVLRSERWPAPLVAWTARAAARTIAGRFIASG